MKAPFLIPFRRGMYAALVICMALALSAFGGCASTPNNAQTGIYAIQQSYNQALAVGAWYGDLTPCSAPAHDPVFCSDDVVVRKIKEAKDVASPALAAAQATVRNPAFDESTSNKILLGAEAAVSVLTAITEPLMALLDKAIDEGKAQPITTGVKATFDGKLNTAAFDLLYVLTLLNALLKTVPEGTARWRKWRADKAKVEEIMQRGKDNPNDPDAGKPTDEEWAALNAETEALEDRIDENAAERGSDPSR